MGLLTCEQMVGFEYGRDGEKGAQELDWPGIEV